MRIALIAPFGLRAKGTARARCLPLGQALARRGHQVGLFIPPYDSAEDSGQAWVDGGVHVQNVVLPGDRTGGNAWQLLLSRRLVEAVGRWNPELVHAFKPKGPSGLAAAMLWYSGRRPRLVVDADDWEGAGGWNDNPRAGYSRLQRRFFAWQERFGLSHADAWTVASRCLRQRAIDLGARPGRLSLLPNGIGEPWLSAPQARERADADVLLYTRFAGVPVEAVARIWQAVLDRMPSARLVVAGGGTDSDRAVLDAMPGTRLLGWLPETELPAVLGQMTMAIVPWPDTVANRARHSVKVLELMAAGLPIVATRVGELAPTLAATADLVPPGDDAAFASAVASLLGDPQRAAQLGEAAQRRVRQDFSWDRIACQAEAAYMNILPR